MQRVLEHKLRVHEGFTSRYNVDKLIYFEEFEDSTLASNRERQLKEGSRAKKVKLIESQNQNWRDLFEETCGNADIDY